MIARKIISLWLIMLFVLPSSPGWGQQQQLEDQAQYYLQQIGPGQAPAKTGVSPQPTVRGELPAQTITPSTVTQILTTAPRQPEEISTIERRAWTHRICVKQFGYSFFYQPPTSFLPVQSVPVGPDYVIGPGDTVRIVVWGSVQGEYLLMVDRNGQLDIPKVGVVHVSSLTFKQLREALDREFSRQYTNFQMNVTLDNLRTIQVYVVGQARFPGSYSMSSLATLVSALFAAGGPNKSGSMRNIQVRRGGKVITHFDMYDLFLHGDKSKDIRLQSEDVIFIPPIGPVAAIGSPKTVKEIEEALKALVRLQMQTETGSPLTRAGTATGTGTTTATGTATTTATDGTSATTTDSKVTLSWRQQEDLRIISRREMKTRMKEEKEDEMTERQIEKRPTPQSWLGPEFDEKASEFAKRIGLTVPEAMQKLALSKGLDFGGPVKVPAIYELKNERSLKELLKLSGGLGDIAFKGRMQVLRIQGRQEMVLFDENLEKVIAQGRDFRIVDGDFVEIFPVPSVVEKQVVIAGAVKSPGEFGFRDNMRVKDLIDYAGGLLQQADKKEAEITRVTITPQGPETTRINIRLFAALSGTPRDNVLLQPNDYLLIRPIPDWNIYRTVSVDGEVKSPGTYAIKKGETLSSVLIRAGGFTTKAYTLGAVLLRLSAKEIQKQQLKAAIDRMEAEILASSGGKMGVAGETDEAKRLEVIVKQQQQLLTSLRKIEPLGRVVIRLDDPERLRGTPDDFELQEGDSLTIPEVQQTVNVVGAVFNPTAMVYTPQRSVKEYVTMAGGTTKSADDKEIYVIKVNGAAVSRKGFKWLGASWDGTKYGYHPGGIGSLTLDPGDTIVVPEQLDRVPWLKTVKDIATIIGQIALTAGVVLVGLRR